MRRDGVEAGRNGRATRAPATGAPASGPRDLLPPAYVNLPVSLLRAFLDEDVDAAVFGTMTCLLGLMWARDYRRTPPLSIDDLAGYLGCSRRTLYRHLKILEEELGWLRVVRENGHVILRSCGQAVPDRGDKRVALPRPARSRSTRSRPAGIQPAAVAEEVAQALAEAGVEPPLRDRLARDPDLTPAVVRAWRLWARHPDRANLRNPAGYVIRRLQLGDPPPAAYVRLQGLTGEERAQLQQARWLGDYDLDAELKQVHALCKELRAAGVDPLSGVGATRH